MWELTTELHSEVLTHPKRVSFRLSLAMYTAMSTARATATATAMTTYHQCQDNTGPEDWPERKGGDFERVQTLRPWNANEEKHRRDRHYFSQWAKMTR